MRFPKGEGNFVFRIAAPLLPLKLRYMARINKHATRFIVSMKSQSVHYIHCFEIALKHEARLCTCKISCHSHSSINYGNYKFSKLFGSLTLLIFIISLVYRVKYTNHVIF